MNTILASGWREAAEEADSGELESRAEDFGLSNIPPEVLFVTAGCDVQHDRLEISFIGHGRDAALVLGHSIIWGSPGDDSTWAELDDLLRSTWQHPKGGTLKLDACVIDSGDGTWTQRVYDFCKPRFARKVLAGKGAAGTRPPLTRSSAKGVPLFIIGVDGLKSQILQRLTRGNTIRFSRDLPTAYYEQVAAERQVIRYVRGAPVRRFERIPGRRAEALDCLVYGLAAGYALALNLDRREDELSSPAAPIKKSAVVKSRWLSG